MRIALAALLTTVAMSAAAPAVQAQAYDPYPWCAEYGGRGGGGTNCYFMTYHQCQAALSGNGGFCRHNYFYTGGADFDRPYRFRHR